MIDGNHQPRPNPLSSIRSWATKTIRVKQRPTTVVEAGDASAALVGLTAVAAVCVLAAVLWRRSLR